MIDFELMALTLHTETYLKDRMHPKGVRVYCCLSGLVSQSLVKTVKTVSCSSQRPEEQPHD